MSALPRSISSIKNLDGNHFERASLYLYAVVLGKKVVLAFLLCMATLIFGALANNGGIFLYGVGFCAGLIGYFALNFYENKKLNSVTERCLENTKEKRKNRPRSDEQTKLQKFWIEAAAKWDLFFVHPDIVQFVISAGILFYLGWQFIFIGLAALVFPVMQKVIFALVINQLKKLFPSEQDRNRNPDEVVNWAEQQLQQAGMGTYKNYIMPILKALFYFMAVITSLILVHTFSGVFPALDQPDRMMLFLGLVASVFASGFSLVKTYVQKLKATDFLSGRKSGIESLEEFGLENEQELKLSEQSKVNLEMMALIDSETVQSYERINDKQTARSQTGDAKDSSSQGPSNPIVSASYTQTPLPIIKLMDYLDSSDNRDVQDLNFISMATYPMGSFFAAVGIVSIIFDMAHNFIGLGYIFDAVMLSAFVIGFFTARYFEEKKLNKLVDKIASKAIPSERFSPEQVQFQKNLIKKLAKKQLYYVSPNLLAFGLLVFSFLAIHPLGFVGLVVSLIVPFIPKLAEMARKRWKGTQDYQPLSLDDPDTSDSVHESKDYQSGAVVSQSSSEKSASKVPQPVAEPTLKDHLQSKLGLVGYVFAGVIALILAQAMGGFDMFYRGAIYLAVPILIGMFSTSFNYFKDSFEASRAERLLCGDTVLADLEEYRLADHADIEFAEKAGLSLSSARLAVAPVVHMGSDVTAAAVASH